MLCAVRGFVSVETLRRYSYWYCREFGPAVRARVLMLVWPCLCFSMMSIDMTSEGALS